MLLSTSIYRVFLLGVMLPMLSVKSDAQELAQYQWQHRVILLCGDHNSDTYQNQLNILSDQELEAELADRKLILIKDSEEHCGDDFKIMLYGLDGGVKLSSSTAVKAIEIFELIDSMPMRRAEIMRRNGKS